MTSGNKALLDLTFAARKPRNKAEQDLLDEINEIEAMGGSVDIPSAGLP
jgi:predicted metal-dependent RNase